MFLLDWILFALLIAILFSVSPWLSVSVAFVWLAGMAFCWLQARRTRNNEKPWRQIDDIDSTHYQTA